MKERHNKCILPSTEETINDLNGAGQNSLAGASSEVLRQLVEGLSRQNEYFEEANLISKKDLERKQDKDDEKKNRLKKLHPSNLQMILNASSVDGEFAAEDVSSSCESFFSQESAGLADRELVVQLRSVGFPDVGFAHGVVQMLLNGQFLYFEPGQPNNYSIFCFFEKLRVKSDNTATMLMHLTSKDGKVKTNDELKESLRQVITTPGCFADMKEQIKIFGAVCKFFFGKDGKLGIAMDDLCKFIRRNESAMKHKCNNDKSLPTNILYAIDTEIQRWFEQCEMATDRMEVDDSIINFISIVNDVLRSRLFIDLPDIFKSTTKHKIVDNPLDNVSPKKRRRLSDNKGNLLKNEEPNEAYKIKDGEDFLSVFGGNNLCHRVDWDGNSKMCPRFHSKQYCFDNCKNKVSHVPKSQVPGNKDKEYKNFLKKVRGN